MDKTVLVTKCRSLVSLACRTHNLRNIFRRKIRGKNNQITTPCALLKKVSIKISGSNNIVVIGDWAVLNGVSIRIHGDNNVIVLGSRCRLVETELWIEDSGNRITIGEKTQILGKTHLAAIEGTQISIGNDCLFSSNIHFSTGDSHSILDMEGRRINASENIVLGNHIWVGTKVVCLKGAAVADHSIIGACALVTKEFTEPHCTLAGAPARVVRTNVDWSYKRIGLGEVAADFQPSV